MTISIIWAAYPAIRFTPCPDKNRDCGVSLLSGPQNDPHKTVIVAFPSLQLAECLYFYYSNTQTTLTNKVQDTISAAKTSIGFDYQFYYYFYLLLDLRHGDSMGIEVKDDIHIDLSRGKSVLIQLKHTLQTNASGDTVNLTERDLDIWKTIGNWIKIIQAEGDQDKFIDNTEFQLVSNKQIGDNPLVQNIYKVKEGELKPGDFKKYLTGLISSTQDEQVLENIKLLNGLGASVLKKLLTQITFSLDVDDLIALIKKRLLEKIQISERVDDVYNSLHSELRNHNYFLVKSGSNIEYTFESFNKRFRKCFQVGISKKLPLRSFDFKIPPDPEKQKFIKKLIAISDISHSDKEEIIQFTTEMLQLYNNLKTWYDEGELLDSDQKRFDSETMAIWKNAFRARFREVKDKLENGSTLNELASEIKTAALGLLDEMRKQILTIDETQLTTELSNGHFYLLSEQHLIGWHYDWQNKEG